MAAVVVFPREDYSDFPRNFAVKWWSWCGGAEDQDVAPSSDGDVPLDYTINKFNQFQ